MGEMGGGVREGGGRGKLVMDLLIGDCASGAGGRGGEGGESENCVGKSKLLSADLLIVLEGEHDIDIEGEHGLKLLSCPDGLTL